MTAKTNKKTKKNFQYTNYLLELDHTNAFFPSDIFSPSKY